MPSTGIFNIDIPVDNISYLTIFNTQGQLVFNRKLEPSLEFVSVDLTGQKSGAYFVKVSTSDGHHYHVKVLKE